GPGRSGRDRAGPRASGARKPASTSLSGDDRSRTPDRVSFLDENDRPANRLRHRGARLATRLHEWRSRERSDATNASAEYWPTTGGRRHSVVDRDFGQDGGSRSWPSDPPLPRSTRGGSVSDGRRGSV